MNTHKLAKLAAKHKYIDLEPMVRISDSHSSIESKKKNRTEHQKFWKIGLDVTIQIGTHFLKMGKRHPQ